MYGEIRGAGFVPTPLYINFSRPSGRAGSDCIDQALQELQDSSSGGLRET
jgi:hypothetical protein